MCIPAISPPLRLVFALSQRSHVGFVLPGVDMLRPPAPPDAVGPLEYTRSQDIANSNWTLEVSLICTVFI